MSHITKIAKLKCKISHFEAEKPLEIGLNLQKLYKTVKSAIFEKEKSLEMGGGFRPRAAHPIKDLIRCKNWYKHGSYFQNFL